MSDLNGIKQIKRSDIDRCLSVIRESFAGVAKSFNITEENCPNHTSFMKLQKLHGHWDSGYMMYGYWADGEIVGYVSLSKEEDGIFELHNLSVLSAYRHRGFGKELIKFCKDKVKEQNGEKLILGFIEDNTRLKIWYEDNGFIHLGTKRFEHLPFTVGFMECIVF